MTCASCGSENRVGRKFCVRCGAALGVACPACGAPVEGDDRFCGECGGPLVADAGGARAAGAPTARTTAAAGNQSAPSAERRVVSVLFADLVGFTPFAEERDAEDVRETLDRFASLAREIVARHGGVIEKFIGDAVMAVWGAPTAHEDDAERAVRSGLELVDAVATLGQGIAARAGVLTGEAAVTLGAVNQAMVAGDLVNTASRLQSVAPTGTVLVGEATVRAADRAIVFEPVGEQTLKGKTAPVAAWRAMRVVAERGGRNRSQTLEAPFAGRADELRLLKDLFHATAREGRPRLVSVVGPAGIGKSRLAWELTKYLDGLVDRVWWHAGRSPAYGEGISFWALGEMVRGRCRLLETDDEATTRVKVAEALAEHVPEEDDRRWIEPALLALLGFGQVTGTEQLFGAWRTFFERLAATGPVVMVFEDFHFADSGLLDFVDHLMEWSRNSPILVLTLTRPELFDRRPDWGAGKRNFTSLYLEPLPEPAMRELLRGLVPGLPEAAVRSIVLRADGIPLYAVETVRMLVADGRLRLEAGAYAPVGDLGELAVPETLTALIASRLDSLGAEERAVVQDGAVLGQSFTMPGLAAVSGRDEAALAPVVRALVRREILTLEADPRSPERGQYAFVQALIREVAYNTLARSDRKVRHLAAARFFESLGTDELAGALAGHYLGARASAAPGAEADALASQARVALRAAAERAIGLGSHELALVFIEQALTVTSDREERASLLLQAGRSAMQTLKWASAERYFDAARVEFLALDDADGVALAAASLAAALMNRGAVQEALSLLEPFAATLTGATGISDAAATPTRSQVAVMSAIARAYALSDRQPQALEWTERLAPIAERLDLVGEIASGWLGRMRGVSGRGREARVLIAAAMDLGIRHGLTDVEARGRTNLTFLLVRQDPQAGLAEARMGLERAQRLGSRLYALSMVGNGVDCAFRVGEWDWAVATLTEWLEADISTSGRIELTADLVRFLACRGEDATPLLAASRQLVDKVSDRQYAAYHWLGEAWRLVAAGDLQGARAAVEEAMAASSIFDIPGHTLAARIAIWRRDAATGKAELAALDATGSHGPAVDTDRITIEAGIAALEGRHGEALVRYRQALDGWQAAGLRWEAALCGMDMGMLLDPDAAAVRVAADRAREIFTELGATPFLARLGDLGSPGAASSAAEATTTANA